jgi:hypothetical protein
MSTGIQRYTPSPAPAPNTPRSLTMDDMWNLATDIASTGFLSVAPRESATPAQILTLMLICESRGIAIIDAVLQFDIIEGKPALKASAMLAEFQKRGGSVEWTQFDEEAAVGRFSHPKLQPTPITVKVDYASCLARGLPQGKDGIKKNWRVHKAALLRARCITTAVRMIYPGIAVGIYSPEEIEDMRDGESATETTFGNLPMPIDITPQTAPQTIAQADLQVVGWRGTGFDSRSYSDLAKSAASEMNDRFTAKARALGQEIEKAPFSAAQIHRAVIVAASDAGYIEKPTGTFRPGELLVMITEKLYPAHRQDVRDMVNAFAEDQLAAATKALETEPTSPQDDAKNQSQETPAPTAREPGEDG